MSEIYDSSVLAAKLPGTWEIAATNLPLWLDGTRHQAELNYELAEGSELTLDDTVTYKTRDGETKTIVGVDRLRGSEFVWKGQGWMNIFTTRWQVIGASTDFRIAVIRFIGTRFSPAGISVLTRKDSDVSSIRSTVAHATEAFGLRPEEFATLTWIA